MRITNDKQIYGCSYRTGHTDFVIMGKTPNPAPGDTGGGRGEDTKDHAAFPSHSPELPLDGTHPQPCPALNTTSDAAHTRAVNTRVLRTRNTGADLGQSLNPSIKLKTRAGRGGEEDRVGSGGDCRAAAPTPQRAKRVASSRDPGSPGLKMLAPRFSKPPWWTLHRVVTSGGWSYVIPSDPGAAWKGWLPRTWQHKMLLPLLMKPCVLCCNKSSP